MRAEVVALGPGVHDEPGGAVPRNVRPITPESDVTSVVEGAALVEAA